MLITILSFLAVLLVLIIAHELGHFLTARAFKVKIEEFGIFMPPRLASFKRHDTIYSLNALPLGGFVRLSGEEDPNAPGSLAGKSKPVRMLVLGAGSLVNLLLPIILLSIALMIPHYTIVGDEPATNAVVLVAAVADSSPASSAGIKAGDVILSVNGQTISVPDDYSNIITANLGKEITATFRESNGTTKDVTMTPRSNPPEGQGATGLQIVHVVKESTPFWKAIPRGIQRYWEILVMLKDGLLATIKGVVPFEVTGPVGIAQATGEVARQGISALLQFAAFISINLGIVNIFPLPALDGGRIVFVLIEWFRHGKRVSPKTEHLVHNIGFILLMLLFLVITYRDIVKL
jgi:regulator of sigma E protease